MHTLDGNGDQRDVRAEVQARISDGRIRPGERIVEQRLAEDIGVSRTPVREALTALMALGQVRRTRSGWETVQYSLDELKDAYAVRAVLESFAAYEAAHMASEDAQAAIRAAYERVHEAAAARHDPGFEHAQLMARLNNGFHEAIIRASRNSRLAGVMDAVVVGPLVFSAFAWYSEEEQRRSDDMHGAICEAISAREPRRAEWLMAEHITEGRDIVLAHLGRSDAGDGGPADLEHLWTRLHA